MSENKEKSLTQILKKFTPSPSEFQILESARDIHLRADNERRILEINASFPAIIHKNELYNLENNIKAVYELNAVKILPHYSSELFSAEYMPQILTEANRVGVVANGFFYSYEYEINGDAITVKIPFGNGGMELLRGAGTAEVISNIIYSEFSQRYSVSFETSSDSDRATSEWRERMEKEKNASVSVINSEIAAREAAENAPPPEPEEEKVTYTRVASLLPDDGGEAVIDGDRLDIGTMKYDLSSQELFFGEEFELKSVTKIRDLVSGRRAVIVGEIFEVSSREFKGGERVSYTIGIYDGDSSIYMKISYEQKEDMSPEQREEAQKLIDFTGAISQGDVVAVSGNARLDRFDQELVFHPKAAVKIKKLKRKDNAEEKRVELHLHTNMSTMDAIISPSEIVKTAHAWGHKAVAITDHGNVQAFPIAMEAAEKLEMKVIYGMEAYFVDDTARAVYGDCDSALDDEFIVFDIETTGLSPMNCKITEIGAVLLSHGEIVAEFNTFVDPECHIPEEITRLTSITDEMVSGAPKIEEALKKFLEFAGDRLLIAHNATFDISFIRFAADTLGIPFSNPYLDTVALSRYVNPDLKRHKLDNLAEYFGLGDFNHHRACDDAAMLGLIFSRMADKLKNEGVESISQMIEVMSESADPLKLKTYHQIILVKDAVGLKNLYKLISASYLDYYKKVPRIPKSVLEAHRDGLILGSACEAGELFSALLENKPESDLLAIADFYDYLEIQPICNNRFLLDNGQATNDEQLRDFNRRIVELGKKANKPVVATCDAHFMNKEDELYRKILLAGMKFKDADRDVGLYMRTTDEMLEEFSYLGEEKAKEVVITNPNMIADMVGDVRPIPKGTYTPNIEGAEEDLERECYDFSEALYGSPLPSVVKDRLDRELTSIIKNGFAVLYMIARKLVKYSESQGYLVGSRGSVGSSYVAFAGGISEVNPLPPHYVCRKCKYSDFSNEGKYGSGFDYPDKYCPVCGELMYSDGHDIPFETFLGFYGDKSPDIDLNFSGEVQAKVHKYTGDLFGKENVFRAGTLGTLADKTAYGFVNKYIESKEISLGKAEISRIISRCVGVKRTTGQHPGGVIVIPKEYEIYDFTPVQHPADDPNSDTITTHFAFSYLHDTILKLDELGHDVPTKYKAIERFTNTSVMDVKMNDPDVYKLFTGTEPLGIKPSDLFDSDTGTLGIPELGTSFVKPVLIDSKPKNFADLIQVSGLTHGEGVWLGNAKDLIDSGTCDLGHVIGTRDGIMLDLINYGLDNSMSFKIMEMVRKNKKGKPIPDDMMAAMKEHNVPEWYIDSLQKIRYMFPKAHAAAYIMSAIRIAWYKVHMPLEFYAGFFTAAPGEFDAEIVSRGKQGVRRKLEEIKEKGMDASQKENAMFATLQLVEEALARGIKFLPVNLNKSDAFAFLPEDGAIRMPFTALNGVGENAAKSIQAVRDEGEIFSVEELQQRSKVTKSVIEILEANGVLDGLSETNQFSMF